jgi:hypothetical protein
VFPHSDLDIKKEYAQIKKNNYLIGDGERACMAVAKFNKNIIASSNFRDITTYCKLNNINFIGTLDILSIAFTKNIFNEEQCDKFIKEALTLNKARFPTGITRIRDYIPSDLSFME